MGMYTQLHMNVSIKNEACIPVLMHMLGHEGYLEDVNEGAANFPHLIVTGKQRLQRCLAV